MASRRRQYVLTGAAALGGLALLVVAVQRVGLPAVGDGVRRVGWPGITAMVVIAGLRFALRTESWRLCMPPHARMPFRQAFAAFLAGDALGNVTPLGMLASEPAKVFLARHRLVTGDAIASLAVDNLVYAGSAVAMIAVGIATALAIAPLPPVWIWTGAAALVAIVGAVLLFVRLMAGTWDEARGPRPRWRQRVSSLRASVLGLVAQQPGRLHRVAGVDAVFHVLAVVEVYVVLRGLLGEVAPTLAQAVVFEGLNRFVTVVFKFVPFRVGVDEASSGALATLVGMDPVTGVTLAVLRKVRNLLWTGVGLVFIAVPPGPGAPASNRPGTA